MEILQSIVNIDGTSYVKKEKHEHEMAGKLRDAGVLFSVVSRVFEYYPLKYYNSQKLTREFFKFYVSRTRQDELELFLPVFA